MNISAVKFEELWKDFVSSFKGNLLYEAKRQPISYGLAGLALSDALSSWTSEYSVNGRWLASFIKEFPKKGALVKEILTKDITLTEEKEDKGLPDSLHYICPIGAGAVGYGVAAALGMAAIGAACMNAVIILAAFPLTKSYLRKRNSLGKEKVIQGYVRQLDKYKESIISVINVDAD